MNELLALSLAILLTVGTGFFVASEFSLVNLDRNELEARRDRGERGLENSIRALKRTNTHLSSAQLGITLTTLLTGFLAEPALSKLLAPTLARFGWAEGVQQTITVVLAILIATLFSFLIGELVPKQFALALPLATNRAVIAFQLAFTWSFSWMIRALNSSGIWVVRRLGVEPREELNFARSAEELSSLVRRSADLGTLDVETADLLTKTLALSRLTAADVMTPRPRMHSIDRTENIDAVIRLSTKTGHSRFPVIDGSSDEVVGVVHIKQAVAVPREKRAEVAVTAIMREVIRVPETMSLERLLGELRAKGLQLAIVVDEYGGTAGLATLEDLIEELVGELGDEHDKHQLGITGGKDSSLLFPGLLRPDELRAIGISVPDDGSYETVAGFMMLQLGRIAEVGDVLEIAGGSLRIERMDGRRIDRIRFIPIQQAGDDDD